jgi:peptidoglycan hydrolase-like protein with peptidoglycan-binding domain
MRKRTISTLVILGILLAGSSIISATGASAKSAYPCTYTTSEPALYEGNSGTAVQQLQCELNYSLEGSAHHPLTVDGSFGQLTETAVLAFQRCAGIDMDGQVGPQTWGALDYWFTSPNFVC